MKRISQPSVLNFFEKKKKSESGTTQINQPLSMSYPTDPEASSSSEKVSSVEEEHELLFENDVGIYLGNPPTDNEKKFKVFQNPWMPPLSYKFPVEKCEKCSTYYPIKSIHQCMPVTVEEPRKLKKILPAVCIGDKVQPFKNHSDCDGDQNKVNDRITDFNSTLCLINAIKARRPLFDNRIPLSERCESIKNKLWSEVYDELQGQFTTDELKKKWKYLKEKYVRERQKAKKSDPKGGKSSKWLHYVQLSFLEEVVTRCHHKKYTTNLDDHSEDSPQRITTAKEQKRKEKNDHNFERHLLNQHTISRPTLPTELNKEPHDSDVAFGKYLVALMKDIPIKKRKKLQYQFIESLISAQDQDE